MGDTPKVEETGKADERRTKNVKERAPRSAGRRMGGIHSRSREQDGRRTKNIREMGHDGRFVPS